MDSIFWTWLQAVGWGVFGFMVPFAAFRLILSSMIGDRL